MWRLAQNLTRPEVTLHDPRAAEQGVAADEAGASDGASQLNASVRRTLLCWRMTSLRTSPVVPLASFAAVLPLFQGGVILALLLPISIIWGCGCEVGSAQGSALWLVGSALGSLCAAWAAPRVWPSLKQASAWRLAAVATIATWIGVALLRAAHLDDPYADPVSGRELLVSMAYDGATWIALSALVLAVTLPEPMRRIWMRMSSGGSGN